MHSLVILRTHTYIVILFIVLGVIWPKAEAATSASGNAFTPDISANFLSLWQRGSGISSDRSQMPHNGFSLQEAEMQFTADVDPYFRAVMLFSVAQESGTTSYAIDPEEVYLESISLQAITMRAGKFKIALGKHNQLHTHTYPFIDAPLIHSQLLGDEGLNEAGISAAILFPIHWYSELTLQAFNPSNDTLYNSPRSGSIGWLTHWKNLWDLNDDLTMELGFSGTMAKNQFDRQSSIFGCDLTFKWRPSMGGKYQALAWTTEYLNGDRPGFTSSTTGKSTRQLDGIASWLQYQFAKRWWLQARGEYIGLSHSDGISTQTKQSALLGFFPSEFSGLRLQYDHINNRANAKADNTIAFQYSVSIGAHPAHAY